MRFLHRYLRAEGETIDEEFDGSVVFQAGHVGDHNCCYARRSTPDFLGKGQLSPVVTMWR